MIQEISWVATSYKATAPSRANWDDLGMDMYATGLHSIKPGARGYKIDLGVILSNDSAAQVKGLLLTLRSSIAMKTGLRMSNSIGIIESQFSGFIANGELYGITLLVDNLGDKIETIKPGDRVAQVLVLDRQSGGGSGYSFPEHSEITDWCTEKDEWQLTYEGRRGGFGSTGS